MTDKPNYARLREGLCPDCGTTLERRESHGWCNQCQFGWAMTTTGEGEFTVDLFIEIESMTINGETGGGSLLRDFGPGLARMPDPRLV